jgi:hypothetical protein
MNNWCICWFLRIILLGILIFKGLTARRLYKSFGVKGLMYPLYTYKYRQPVYNLLSNSIYYLQTENFDSVSDQSLC